MKDQVHFYQHEARDLVRLIEDIVEEYKNATEPTYRPLANAIIRANAFVQTKGLQTRA